LVKVKCRESVAVAPPAAATAPMGTIRIAAAPIPINVRGLI
jgi:hypothetical protein